MPALSAQAIFVHGQRTLAETILQKPAEWMSDPAVATYDKAKREGQQLGIKGLEALAIALSRHTAQGNPTVGGPDQIAILTKSHIEAIRQPVFHRAPAPTFHFHIDQQNEITGAKALPDEAMAVGLDFEPGTYSLVFGDSFTDLQQKLRY